LCYGLFAIFGKFKNRSATAYHYDYPNVFNQVLVDWWSESNKVTDMRYFYYLYSAKGCVLSRLPRIIQEIPFLQRNSMGSHRLFLPSRVTFMVNWGLMLKIFISFPCGGCVPVVSRVAWLF